MSLYLSNNRIHGALPSFANLPILQHLELDNNLLSGNFPTDFMEGSSSLNEITLSFNGLSGPLPNLPACLAGTLTQFSVDSNSLHGPFPSTWPVFSQLKMLTLSLNSLSGALPSYFWSIIPNVGILDLSSNFFNGSIPSLANSQPKIIMSHLIFANNSFTGALPANISATQMVSEGVSE